MPNEPQEWILRYLLLETSSHSNTCTYLTQLIRQFGSKVLIKIYDPKLESFLIPTISIGKLVPY